MLVRPTVFILGAGSSAQFSFPVGTGLADAVARKLAVVPDGSRIREQVISDAVNENFGPEIPDYVSAADRVSRGVRSFRSIDDFLYSHSDDPRMVRIGKLGIARSIEAFEQESFLARLWSRKPDERTSGQEQLRSTWAHPLIQLLATNCRRADIDKLFDEVCFINFNYDRCIETVLFHGIQPARGGSSRDEQTQGLSAVRRPW